MIGSPHRTALPAHLPSLFGSQIYPCWHWMTDWVHWYFVVLKPSAPTCHWSAMPTGATSEIFILLIALMGISSWNPCATSFQMILVSADTCHCADLLFPLLISSMFFANHISLSMISIGHFDPSFRMFCSLGHLGWCISRAWRLSVDQNSNP